MVDIARSAWKKVCLEDRPSFCSSFLLSSIGDIFAAPEGVRLEADATGVNPDFRVVHMQDARFELEERAGNVKELFSAIQEIADDDAGAITQDGEENRSGQQQWN
jgi:hypothetical protein